MDMIFRGLLALGFGVLSLIVGGISILHVDEDGMDSLVEGDALSGWYEYLFHILAHILIFAPAAFMCVMLIVGEIATSMTVIPLIVCIVVCVVFFFLPLFFRYSVSHFMLHLSFGITYLLCAIFAQDEMLACVLLTICAFLSIFSGSVMHNISHWFTGGIIALGGVYNIISVIAVLIYTLVT